MGMDELHALATRLGIRTEDMKERTEVLTRLLDNAVSVQE